MEFNVTTFLFELVNFLVLLWILRRIVFQPLRRGIEERRVAAAARGNEARAMMRDAEAMKADYDHRSQELASLRERVLSEASAQAAKERARMLDQARGDAEAERTRARHVLEMEREAALGWAKETIVEESTELAGRLLLELAPGKVDRVLLDQLLLALERDATALSDALAKDGTGGSRPEVEVTSARPLEETDAEPLREKLSRALGVVPRLNLREDESLVAGVVVRVGSRVLDASLGGHLQVLRARARELLEGEAALA